MTDKSVHKTNWPALYAIAMVGLLDLFGFGVVFPLLSKLAEQYHGGGVQVGWLMALYALMQFVFSPVMGSLSDRFGRKPMLTWGLVGLAGGHVLFALTDTLMHILPITNAFLLMYVARAVSGLFSSHMGVAQAFIADNSTGEDRARGMGIMGMGYGVGFILGPAVGGIVAANYGLLAPFWLAAGSSLAGALVAQLLLPNKPPAEKFADLPRQNRWELLRHNLRQPGRPGAFILFFLVPFGFAAVEVSIVLFGKHQLDLDEGPMGYLFAFAGVMMIFTQGWLLGVLRKRWSEVSLIRLGAIFLPLGMAMIPLTAFLFHGGWVTAVGGVPAWLVLTLFCIMLMTVGDGLKEPSLFSYLSQKAEDNALGGTMGAAHSVSAMARVTGPLFAGQVFDRLGPAWPFYTGAIILLAGTVVAWTMLAKTTPVNPIPAAQARSSNPSPARATA